MRTRLRRDCFVLTNGEGVKTGEKFAYVCERYLATYTIFLCRVGSGRACSLNKKGFVQGWGTKMQSR